MQHLLLEIHVTPRYGLKHVAQFNRLMGHTIDDHGFRLFHKPRRNRGFPWARNETLPALVKGGQLKIARVLLQPRIHQGVMRSIDGKEPVDWTLNSMIVLVHPARLAVLGLLSLRVWQP